MKDIEGRLRSYMDAPWAKAPKAYQNIVHEDENVIVFKDGFPVTEGHLLFVPKKVTQQLDITRCFELAYKWGVRGVCDYKWVAFNVGINNGVEAGQSVMWPHVHMIPRRKGDTPNPKGGVRHVIPFKGNYCDEDSTCPIVDDNTSREELDNWKKRYKGYREWKKKIPMKDLADLEEVHDGCFDDRNWFDKDSRMV